MITLGIDPGARYTGVVVRDEEHLLWVATYVRPKDIPPVTWAHQVTQYIRKDVLTLYPGVPIGIEGIADPKGYQQGQKSPINPRDIIRAAIVLGALAESLGRTNLVVIIPPKKNGSGTYYPAELNGVRPADLPGLNNNPGTRNHEKSAYDVAGEVLFQINDGFKLDMRPDL